MHTFGGSSLDTPHLLPLVRPWMIKKCRWLFDVVDTCFFVLLKKRFGTRYNPEATNCCRLLQTCTRTASFSTNSSVRRSKRGAAGAHTPPARLVAVPQASAFPPPPGAAKGEDFQYYLLLAQPHQVRPSQSTHSIPARSTGRRFRG